MNAAVFETAPCSRPDLDLVIGTWTRGDVVKSSRRRPSKILADVQNKQVALDGLVVELRPDAFRLLIALLALRGRFLDRFDAELLLWGDRKDGGPETAITAINVCLVQVRAAALALGYRIDNRWGQGWNARPCLSERFEVVESLVS